MKDPLFIVNLNPSKFFVYILLVIQPFSFYYWDLKMRYTKEYSDLELLEPVTSKIILMINYSLLILEFPKKKEILTLLRDPLNKHTGTVVLWQRLDRMLGFKHPYSEPARKKLISMCRELEWYLAMVFHKFLANETNREPLEIYLNFNKIIPINKTTPIP